MISKLILLLLVVSIPMTKQINSDNVEQLFQGVLEGFLSETTYDQIESCIGDVSEEARLIVGGVESMLKKTKTGMKEGLQQLAEALQTVPEAMIECKVVLDEAKKLTLILSQIKSPLKFAYHVGTDLVINGIDIYNEVNEAIADYKDDDFLGMGQNIGQICQQVLIGYNIRKELTNSMNSTEVEQLFKGILEGFLSSAQYEHVVPCLGDLYQEGDLVVESVDEFMKQDTRSVAKGLELLGTALAKLPNAMTECGEAIDDARSLINAFAQFKSPVSFVYHLGKDLIVNGVQIFNEIGQSIQDFQHQQFEDMGVQIGKAAEQLLLGQTGKISTNEVQLIFKGVIEGFLPQEDTDKLIPCLKDLEDEATLVYQSVLDFLKKDLSDVKKGLKELGQALESLPKSMEDCNVSVTEIQKIQSIITQFKSPISFAYHVGMDLVVNGVQIFEDIEEAVADYKLQEFEQMGKSVGHAMSKLLIGKTIILTSKRFLN